MLTGRHHTIQYNFLIAGHTKFAPDWCFGLVKQRTRKTFISSLFDIARVVVDSAIVNTAELVGLHNGTVLIPTYDWMSYLDTFFKKIPHLKTYHHFRLAASHIMLARSCCFKSFLPFFLVDFRVKEGLLAVYIRVCFGPCLASCFKKTRNSKIKEELKCRNK